MVPGRDENFVPDPRAALIEMARLTAKGGTIAACVWNFAGKMELMRYFRDAAVELDADVAKPEEGVRVPRCRPGALAKLFDGAGLAEVKVKAVDIPTLFAKYDDNWQPFLERRRINV